MTKLLNGQEYRRFVEDERDPVIHNALLYGGERVFFVQDAPCNDFDMLHYGRILHSIFRDKASLNLLNKADDLPALKTHPFPNGYMHVHEAIEYASKATPRPMRVWLNLCLQKTADIPMSNESSFDLLFFIKAMEKFLWDELTIPTLLAGGTVGGAFDLE